MLNRRALFGLPLAALPVPASAEPEAVNRMPIDEDFYRRLNPAVAAGLSARFIGLAQTRLTEVKEGSDFHGWHGVVVAAVTAEGHARQLYEIARIRMRDSFKAEPQS